MLAPWGQRSHFKHCQMDNFIYILWSLLANEVWFIAQFVFARQVYIVLRYLHCIHYIIELHTSCYNIDILTFYKKKQTLYIGSKGVLVKSLQVSKLLFEERIYFECHASYTCGHVLTNIHKYTTRLCILSQVCLKDTLILLLYLF